MNAYDVLKDLIDQEPITEDYFNQLKLSFSQKYLESKEYYSRIELHRNAIEVVHEIQRELNDYLQKVQQREELCDLDVEKNSSGHVHTKVYDIWKADKRLKSSYRAIDVYRNLRNKSFNVVAVHFAEYRALDKLYFKLERDRNKMLTEKSKKHKMPKNFEIERRETYNKPYLKVFLKAEVDYQKIAACLEPLHSVKRANLTDQQSGKRDLTIYPQKAYDISEVEQEIELALINYFNGSQVDPTFVTETLSAISDKAYFQILDYILLLGKNLEGFKELNARFDEERYRDYFIPFLNAISSQHSAKGEVFNRNGKTDILIFDNDGNNIFIAECKLWRGEAYLIEAVDQLLNNYVNWRDEKTSIIIFNRDVKKFTEVVETATKAISNHKFCLKFLGKRKETSYSYIFKHPDDDSKLIKLELLLLHFA